MKFLDALNCVNSGRPPVWIMRQAGRYMPEYRAIREKYSFVEMTHTPELAAEITAQPIRAFGMDAAILFSDILVVAEALGVPFHIEEKVGPVMERPVSCAEDLKRLDSSNISEKLNYVAEAIKLIDLPVPLIGFAGGPFTLTHYMAVNHKQWLFEDPKSFHQLLGMITDATIDYLNMQVAAGVDAVQIFDSWVNALAPKQFEEFSLPYLKKIVDNVNAPTLLFCRGSSIYAEQLASLQPNGISLDWNASLPAIREKVGPNIALQGNLDPDVLSGPFTAIRKEVRSMVESMEGDPGYIFNLGHGILPHHKVDAVRCLVETIKEYQPSSCKQPSSEVESAV